MAETKRVTMITLSPDDLREAVVRWAQGNMLMPVDADATVRINVTSRLVGYGTSEHPEYSGEVVLTVKG